MRVAAVFVYGLAASMLFAWVFQNHIIYNCGGPRLFERRRLPPSAYNLPTPQTLHNGTITAFERSGSDTFIYYYHGNGRRAHDDYWFLGQLYAVCNCSIYAIEYPQCLEPATLFGHSAQSLIAWQTAIALPDGRVSGNGVCHPTLSLYMGRHFKQDQRRHFGKSLYQYSRSYFTTL